jgi:hypothetical protein
MRRWMAAPLVLAPAVWLTTLGMPSALAQPAEPTKETFRTPDGMELHGLFHPTSKNANTAPVVVFMYAPGADRDMTKGDWGTLAKKLNEEGLHVFQFDWRGHGKSTSIKDKDKFWKNQYLNGGNSNFNVYIKGGPPVMPLKNDLSVKDITNPARFLPAYINDLAGVRLYLDTKNDNKELNSSSIYVVGTEEAAGLGMAWMTSEWKRPAVMPTVNLLGLNVANYEYVPQRLTGTFDEAGADFGGAVWLTATRPISMPAPTIQKWISNRDIAPKLRDNTPMLFLFGEKDATGKRASEFFFREVLVADPTLAKRQNLEVPEQTFIKDVKGGEQLKGLKLLGQNATLKTEDTIIQYFSALQKVRQKLPSKTRDWKAPYYIDVRYFGLAP